MDTASGNRDDTIRAWVLVVVALLVIVGLLAFVRGPDHHRGDEEGALTPPAGATAA